MSYLDYTVFFIYLAGFFVIGSIFSRMVKNASDMFVAGRRSPWWMAGFSAFMTMFSAGTFVVWGGIAYKWGLVAISINMCYGVAALLAGRFVATRWHDLGVSTPAEYIGLRFGAIAVQFYTWTMMIYRILGVAVSLYALAILLVAMMPMGESSPFRDAQTGNLALFWAVLLFGSIVILYTMAGGLWAVLVTDVLQFVVLTTAVAFVILLMLVEAGGIGTYAQALPEGFFRPVTSELTWLFLAGWCTVHFFMIGAEWAFVQRFICVPAAADARRATYLFAGPTVVVAHVAGRPEDPETHLARTISPQHRPVVYEGDSHSCSGGRHSAAYTGQAAANGDQVGIDTDLAALSL